MRTGKEILGRKGVLLGFWVGGYVLGAFAWMVKGPLLQFIESVGLSSDTAEGMIAGLFGSSVMVLSILFWSFLSSPN